MNLRRRTLAALPLLAFARPVWAQKKLEIPATWYGVRIDESAISVQMPGVPDHRVAADASPRGTAFELHSYTLEADGNSYAAQTALYPADVDVAQPRAILQAALNGRAAQLTGGKWTKVDWREVKGAAAVESTGGLAGGNVLRQLSLLKERRFVSLAFLGPAAAATGADAERFFKSLKLV